ncbi:MAG TPA: glutathione S-transferase family protein [Stellaceae bacterium]|nr:glutathione S-transferase family protein [Stellaceae bacterium]
MAEAKLVISSKNYSSWGLRGWLLCKFAGLDFEEEVIPPNDPVMRAEILLLSPSFLVPRLIHHDLTIWDTLAIGEYLNEIRPEAGLLPKERAERALCRAISGEMHQGFSSLRSALPMNISSHHPNYKIYSGARADIERICTIWRDTLALSGGPFLFGKRPTMADAMYAPVATRFVTYDVKLDPHSATYRDTVLALPAMREWIAAAKAEPQEIEEFEVEF